MQNNAHINARNESGRTSLEKILRSRHSHLKLIKTLLAYEADLYHVGKDGKTMLDTAKSKSPELKELIEDYVNLVERVTISPDNQAL